MKSFLVGYPRFLALVPMCGVGFALFASSAMANAVLIHDYELNGSLADLLGGPSLVSNGGTLGATGYSFAANQSLTLSGLTNPTNYTIEMRFDIDATDGYRKLIDFKNLTSDDGLYNRSGFLNFYNWTSSPPNQILAGVATSVVVTRDGTTGLFTGYVNGNQVMGFNDSAIHDAEFNGPSNILTFFADDLTTGQREASSGFVDYIRIYDGAATATNGTLDPLSPAAVPDVSHTLALLTLALAGLAGVIQVGRRASVRLVKVNS